MKNKNNTEQVCVAIEEVASYIETLLDARTYDDNICFLLGLLSDVEHILVAIGNMRFDSLLTEKQIQLEEQIFDEWIVLYKIAKSILTKRKYSQEYKKMIDEHSESTFAKLREFEKTIRKKKV